MFLLTAETPFRKRGKDACDARYAARNQKTKKIHSLGKADGTWWRLETEMLRHQKMLNQLLRSMPIKIPYSKNACRCLDP
jgi:hypothetical protein